ncbi:MAG: bifunctional serine/threonine-protein kinase/formylglycine-generating enzyme family protein [Verrucomicrobiota bacterium]
MVKRGREAPEIPDHEVLRCVGSGAFGEVWLARTVTGVYRAVKVIWRDDFDREIDFEREFEAIRRFEPLSRQHAGLVDVLQVGREEPFYYYIMEVADDLHEGVEFDPDHYTPQTFRATLVENGPMDLGLCSELGARLAEALHFLHQNDLIHRDVKLSNVILVRGEARLADIGLVAALGDRSFVGTEGYVPPEGAGTPSADIYSLGMVLYELSTGKDRLDFPDVPTHFRELSDPTRWRRLNEVVCKACARRPESRYRTAEDMAHALRGETQAQPLRWPTWVGVGASLLLMGFLLALFLREGTAPEGFSISTDPEGAAVYAGEEYLGITPLELNERPQEGVSFEFQLSGYRHETVDYAGASDARAGLSVILEDSKFPQPGVAWENSLGLSFKPVSTGHELERPIHPNVFFAFLEETDRPLEGYVATTVDSDGVSLPYVVVGTRDGRLFADWMRDQDQMAGFIGGDYTYRIGAPDSTLYRFSPAKIKTGRTTVPVSPLTLVAEKQQYGSLMVISEPPGAEVVGRDGEVIGNTPLEVVRVKTGKVSFEVRLPGYRPAYPSGTVEANGLLELREVLVSGEAVAMGTPWQNTLGTELLPVGGVLMASTETRVAEYRVFCQEEGRELPEEAGARAQGQHPIDRVSREDAESFCVWLTRREIAVGAITSRHGYRLPSDVEWSYGVGLPRERGATPAARNGAILGVYPWGYEWPPSVGAGNYADLSYAAFVSRLSSGLYGGDFETPLIIEAYDDTFPQLAWVNELLPNRNGLYHMGGNVWEWVSDNYFGGGGGENAGTIRGGSWRTADQAELLSSYRRSLDSGDLEAGVGFRYVLALKP